MTQELVFLFVGYAVIWVLLFGYLVFVTGRIRGVRDAVRDVRRELDAQRRQAGGVAPPIRNSPAGTSMRTELRYSGRLTEECRRAPDSQWAR